MSAMLPAPVLIDPDTAAGTSDEMQPNEPPDNLTSASTGVVQVNFAAVASQGGEKFFLLFACIR